ncbi:MAG: dynamin family protein [Verrucomicrobiales bacterium]|nr:dynamin family protein [Verrucomicrobiales bacterium]
MDEARLNDEAEHLLTAITSAKEMRFAIGVVGLAKRGKSTLVNALLGRRDDVLAPIGKFPATNVVSCFAGGERERVRVFFDTSDGSPKEINTADIKHYACEEFNPGNQKNAKTIEVVGRFPGLGGNTILVDTPGADNALTSVHDTVLLDYLPRLDAVVFLVEADEPLTPPELELLKHVRKRDARKVLFVINKADRVDPDELNDAINHNLQGLQSVGFGDVEIFTISAKAYFQGKGDVGTERLVHAISELINKDRIKIIADSLTEEAVRVLDKAKVELTSELELSQMSEDQIRAELEEITTICANLEQKRPEFERRFRESWRSAFFDFEDGLRPIEKQMISEYQHLVENTPGRRLDALGKTIHTDVLKRVEELVETEAERLTTRLDETVRSLEVDYGGIWGIAPQDADAIVTHRKSIGSALDIAAAGAPSAIGAIVVSALPGVVGSAIVAAAPVAAITWNPLTWLVAVGAAPGALATGVTSGVVATTLAPVAAIGAPLLFTYAGYKAFSAWRFKVSQNKNQLSMDVKSLINSVFIEMKENAKRLQSQDEEILSGFGGEIQGQISESRKQMNELIETRPDPQRIEQLKGSIFLIENAAAPKTLASEDPTHEERPIFS